MSERSIKTQDRIAQPSAIDHICAAITAGSTLAAWCREEDVIFQLVAAWLELNEDRRKRYREAIDVREQHHKDEIVEQLRNMVTSDVLTAFADDGTLLPLKDIPLGVRQWIAGMEVEELYEGRGESREQVGIVRKIKFYDKTRNIELLMKNLKMLVEQIEHKGLSLAELIADPKAGARS